MKSNRKITSILKLLAVIPVIGIIVLFFSCQDNSSNNMNNNSIQAMDEQSSNDAESSARIDEPESLQVIYENQIMEVVDVQPVPVGGMMVFYHEIQAELKYPKEAKEKGIEGKVLVEFVIDIEENIRNVKTLKGISHGCDVEAERVLNTIDVKWTPAIHDFQKVNCRMVIPIIFKLS